MTANNLDCRIVNTDTTAGDDTSIISYSTVRALLSGVSGCHPWWQWWRVSSLCQDVCRSVCLSVQATAEKLLSRNWWNSVSICVSANPKVTRFWWHLTLTLRTALVFLDGGILTRHPVWQISTRHAANTYWMQVHISLRASVLSSTHTANALGAEADDSGSVRTRVVSMNYLMDVGYVLSDKEPRICASILFNLIMSVCLSASSCT